MRLACLRKACEVQRACFSNGGLGHTKNYSKISVKEDISQCFTHGMKDYVDVEETFGG